MVKSASKKSFAYILDSLATASVGLSDLIIFPVWPIPIGHKKNVCSTDLLLAALKSSSHFLKGSTFLFGQSDNICPIHLGLHFEAKYVKALESTLAQSLSWLLTEH